MIIYSKYNSNRKEKFQLITKIEKKNEKIFSSKTASNEKSILFLNSIFYKFNHLKSKNFSFDLVEPNKISKNKISFEYRKGESLNKSLFDLFKNNDKKEFLNLLNKYVELLKKNKIKKESLNFEFKETFGGNDNLFECIQIGCLDLNFDNIILNDSQSFYVIDYEWTFDFPIPYKYIFFRAIVNFYVSYFQYDLNNKFIALDELFKIFEITKEDENIFIEFEYNFQNFVNLKKSSLKEFRINYLDLKNDYIVSNFIQQKSQEINNLNNQINFIQSSKFWKLRENYLYYKNKIKFAIFCPKKFIKKYLKF